MSGVIDERARCRQISVEIEILENGILRPEKRNALSRYYAEIDEIFYVRPKIKARGCSQE